jgi:hypothetical protein
LSGAGIAQGAGDLAQRLAHEPGLQADVAVAHLALDLRTRHERGHRVDDDDVERAGTDQHVGDLEGLLPRVRLGDEQGVGVDAEGLGVLRVERVLRVDERGDATRRLRVGHRVQGDGGLSAGLRAVDLHDTATGQAADAEGDVEGDGPGGDDPDGRPGVITEAHHRALAVVLLDLGEREFESLLAVGCGGHRRSPPRCSDGLSVLASTVEGATDDSRERSGCVDSRTAMWTAW